MSQPDLVFQLSGTCNNFDWGKQGRESLAARLCAQTPGTGFAVDDDKMYSEMWFGDYPDFPGRVLETGELLGDHLKKHKEVLLGEKVINELDGQLPYLPKILSIRKALPLQVHPNKPLAAQLHAQNPQSFTDPNHKPEIAIALSDFEVFAGWKPLSSITPLFNSPALRHFIPPETTTWTDETLRAVTREILLADEGVIQDALEALSRTPKDQFAQLGHDNAYIRDLIPRLRAQYGARDPGSLIALLCMNYMALRPGEALYVPADGIHAYLSGDIVECMARSNNVLNTGFCPRAARDSVDLFCGTLTFGVHAKEDLVLPRREACARGKKGRTGVYSPPMSEFDMLFTDVEGMEEEVVSAGEGPGVAIVTGGRGVLEGAGKRFEVQEGFIFFVAPGVEVRWVGGEDGLRVFTTVV